MSKEKESEKGIMKEKKKMSLAMQIFIALVLAIAAGLLLQRYAQFAETYIKPFGTIFLNLLKFNRCSYRAVFHHVWNHLDARY